MTPLVSRATELELLDSVLDRTLGESSFDLKGWVPKYLRWYFFAFGPALTVEEVRREAAKIAARNEEASPKRASRGKQAGS